MSTALTVYMTNTTGSTLAATYQLSATHGVDNTNVTQDYTLLGTATAWGEVVAQGTTNAWGAAGSIGSPSGKGFMLESATLNLAGQRIAAGSWSGVIRLSIGHSDGTLGGTITADIHMRAYRYRSGVYTSIVDMALTGQTVPATSGSISNYSLSGTGSATDFLSGDLLYTDIWMDVTANVTADSIRAIRLNRISTNFTGDSSAQWVTPGYDPTPGGGSSAGPSFVNGLLMSPGYFPGQGGSL
jgi:hypothetical protein